MAATTVDAFADGSLGAWFGGILKRVAGLALVGLAVLLVLALLGYDPRDPSLDTATASAPSNLLGLPGAATADLLVQFFGGAAWLLPASLAAFGARLALRRALRWPWLPPLVLPLALLSMAAFLGQFGGGGHGRPGAGGLVGFVLWDRIETRVGHLAYFWTSLVVMLLLVVVALGLRWRSAVRAAGHAGTASMQATRRLRRAASPAERAPEPIVAEPDGRRRRTRVATRVDDAPPPAPAWRRPGAFLRGGVGLRGGAGPDPDEDEDEDGEVALAPPASRRPAIRRPGRPAPEPGLAEPSPAPYAAEPAAEPAPSQPSPHRPAPAMAAASLPLSDGFVLPPLELLGEVKHTGQVGFTEEALGETSRQLESVLDDFGVRGQIVDAKPGPVVTLYELEPAPGTRAARVVSLADDIARSLCALSVRVATVPGRNVIGVELPNDRRETVFLRDLLESGTYQTSGARLPLTLGKDISGRPIVVDLARMPHLLIAGTTGSGKSVAINAMILSLLYRLTPAELRLIMIDPKVIELSVYEDIPHLLSPVVTEPHKAVVALKWIVRQMDERYRLMAHLGVRDIFAFNRRIQKSIADGEELKRRVRTGFEPGTGAPIFEDQPIESKALPLIVVIVDEVADLMLTAGKEIENCIQRLSQKARAAGIHLIVATQRPSVDVLTGVIKANLPSRISFRVSSKIDSRTILGEPGAEQLLGQGDMLHLMPGDRIARIHGPLVTDGEVENVVAHVKAQGEPDYVDDVTSEDGDEPQADGPLFDAGGGGAGGSSGGEPLYQQAVQIVLRDGKASTSYLQRKLTIGYNNAAKLIERLEKDGIISGADHVGRRQVLRRQGAGGSEPEDDDETPF